MMKVSVAICSYNGEKFIEEQLESIIDQTRKVDEIILGDDNSSDHTVLLAEEVLKMSGINYKIIKNEKNLGVTKNFSNIMQFCTGDIVFTADQDDVWRINKVELVLDYFKQNPECVLVFSNGIVTDENLNPIGDLWESVNFTNDKRRMFKTEKYFDVLFSNNVVTGAAMAVRQCLINEILPLSTDINILHDYWFALNAPLYGKIGMIDSPLFYYRQHGENVVGVQNNLIIHKIQRWIKAVRNMQGDSMTRIQWSKMFYLHAETIASKTDKNRIKAWIEFNIWRDGLKSKNLCKCVLSILYKKIIGDYSRFYNLKFAALQDIFACIFRREK